MLGTTFKIEFLDAVTNEADHAAECNLCSGEERDGYEEMSRADQLEYGLAASAFSWDLIRQEFPGDYALWRDTRDGAQIEFLVVNENFRERT